MEELKSCRICGRLFEPGQAATVCPTCLANEDADFIKIREYLHNHPHASVYEVATTIGISINKIKHFLREGRIEIVERNNQFLDCEICGKPIQSGRYCDECFRHGGSGTKGVYTGTPSLKPDKSSSASQEIKLKYHSKDSGQSRR